MKYSICLLYIICFMYGGLCSCSHKSDHQRSIESKQDGQTLMEAYKNHNWNVVVAIGDTLIGDDDPKNITIPYAEALAAVGNYQKAIILLDKKITKNPSDYYLFETKGNVFYAAEEFDSALVNYEIVISMKPTYARPYINEGEIYEIVGEKEKAISSYIVAAKLFAVNNFSNESLEFCNRVLNLDPSNIEAKEIKEELIK